MFLGCVIPARIPFIEKSAQVVFDNLGIDFSNFENVSCCPDPTSMPAVSHKTWLTMGARNLSLINNQNETEVISLCSGCVETLKMVNHELNSKPALREEINQNLASINKKFEGSVNIKHAGQLLYENLDKIKDNVKNPLNKFKIAVHYGCHFLRPSAIIKWDDPFEPKTLDELVTVLGGESIEYPSKMECCGGPTLKTDNEIGLEMLYQKLNDMEKAGVNCIMVVCPACFLQFDYQQRSVNKKYETNFKFPIFYLTELIALAMGENHQDLGLKYHGTKPMKLLKELSFIS